MIRLLFGLAVPVLFAALSTNADAQLFPRLRVTSDCGGMQRVFVQRLVAPAACSGVSSYRPAPLRTIATAIASPVTHTVQRVRMERICDGVMCREVPIVESTEVAATSTAVGVQSVETQAISNRVAFRRAFMEAARQALKSKEINLGQFLMIATASRSEKVLNHVEASLHEAAIAEGYATANGIDWDKLTEFFRNIDWAALLDFITKLISLFG